MAITKTGTEQLANSLLFSRQGKRPGVGVIPKGSVANLARIAVDPTRRAPTGSSLSPRAALRFAN